MLVGFEKITPDAPARLRVTQLYTGSEYIHAELFFETLHGAGFAARVSTDGITMQPFSEIMPKEWVFFRVPVWDEKEVIAYVNQYAGRGFSFRNIATMVTGINMFNPNARFCSELAYEVIQRFSMVPVPMYKPYEVTPAELLGIVRNAGFQQVFL